MLGGIADTVAQTLTAIRMRQKQKLLNPEPDSKDDFFTIEITELDKKVPWPDQDFMVPLSKRGPPPFDFERSIRFMAYGFLWAPAQHTWFGFLERTFPLRVGMKTSNALKRVAMDQFLFAPCGMALGSRKLCWKTKLMIYAGLATFFTFMTVAEGGGKRAVWRKFQEVYIPALKANYIVWPAVQILNFRVMPIQFQIVRDPTWLSELALTPFAAVCQHHRYLLDGVPLNVQLCRRATEPGPELTMNCAVSL